MKLILINDADDPESANWYVDGVVGDRPYRFILDTGAGITTMASDDYLSKLQKVGAKDSAGVFEKTSYDVVVIPSLRVGSLSKNNIKIGRSLDHRRGTKHVLGMNFFKDNAFHFLFDTGEVQIVDVSQTPSPIPLLDLFMGENSHPYVDLSWQSDIYAKGVWDTGAGMTVFDMEFIKKYPHLFVRVGSSVGTDSTGAKSETPIYEMKGFNLGGKRFPPARVVGVDLSVPNSTIKTRMDFILGYNILKKANWIFDFSRRKWAISKMLP